MQEQEWPWARQDSVFSLSKQADSEDYAVNVIKTQYSIAVNENKVYLQNTITHYPKDKLCTTMDTV